MKCPHCDKQFDIPNVAYLNVESYGSSMFVIHCNKCKQKIRIYGKRQVKFTYVRKAHKAEELSW